MAVPSVTEPTAAPAPLKLELGATTTISWGAAGPSLRASFVQRTSARVNAARPGRADAVVVGDQDPHRRRPYRGRPAPPVPSSRGVRCPVTAPFTGTLTPAASLVCFNSGANDRPDAQDLRRLADGPAVAHRARRPRGGGLRGRRHAAGLHGGRTTRSSTASGPTSGRTRVGARCWPRGRTGWPTGATSSTGYGPRRRSTSRSATTPSTAWCAGCRGRSRHGTRTSSPCGSSCIPRPGYPFSLLLEIEYHVGRDGLTVTTKARSLDEGTIPFGLGFHPYLTAGSETVDGAILQVPARHTLDLDDRGLPTGALTPVEGTDRDFTAAALRRAGRTRHGVHHPRARRRGPRLGQPRRTRWRRRRRALGRPGLPVPDGVHGGHAARDPAPATRRCHRADDVPAERPAHRQGRHRPPAGPGVVGPLGHRARGERRRRERRRRCAGQVVVVTGSSSGIGAATARAFADAGASVLVNSARSVAEGEAVAASLPRRALRAGRHHRRGRVPSASWPPRSTGGAVSTRS